MSNPIFDGFRNQPLQNQQSSQNNQSMSLLGLMTQIRNSPNPNEAAMNMLNTNPQFKDVMQYINQNGGTAQAAFYNMARQNGQNPDAIVNTLKQIFGT